MTSTLKQNEGNGDFIVQIIYSVRFNRFDHNIYLSYPFGITALLKLQAQLWVLGRYVN